MCQLIEILQLWRLILPLNIYYICIIWGIVFKSEMVGFLLRSWIDRIPNKNNLPKIFVNENSLSHWKHTCKNEPKNKNSFCCFVSLYVSESFICSINSALFNTKEKLDWMTLNLSGVINKNQHKKQYFLVNKDPS